MTEPEQDLDQPLRILHLSALPVWAMQGNAGMPSLRETLAGHVRAGHRVILVVPGYNLFSGEPVSAEAPEGIEVHPAPCNWIPRLQKLKSLGRRKGREELPYALRWLTNMIAFVLMTLSLTRAARRAIRGRRGQIDLVYAHNQYAVLAGRRVARSLGVPNVARLYGTFLADLMNRPLVRLRYPTAAAGYLVPHSLLICTNDGTRGDQVARKLGIDLSRFRFWQNGVDVPAEPVAMTREQVQADAPAHLRLQSRWIVSCSRLSYWKRIDRMIRAVHAARQAGVDCQLLVAGDGPEQESLQALTDELGVQEDVVWLGAVSHDRVWGLMHLADAFMITNDVTNRCNPLYEAMSTPLPVVSVRDPSTADLLEHEHNALLADPADQAALDQCLIRVLQDADLAERLRANQRERAAAFQSWPERLDMEVRELESLVAARRT